MNKKGYVIFNAEGKQPEATLAALDNSEFVQVIADGTHGELLKLFGAIAESLHTKSEVPKDILHMVVDAAIISGNAWAAVMTEIERSASEAAEEQRDPDEAFNEIWSKLTGEG